MHIRQATLDDAQRISRLFREKIERWQRINADGQVEDLPYEDLNVYERWLHGGAWMSIETAAIWLSHLQRTGCLMLLFEDAQADAIFGYVEAYPGDEPEPFGKHLYLQHLIPAADAPADIMDTMMQHLMDEIDHQGRLSVSCTPFNKESMAFYRRYAFTVVEHIYQVNMPAQGANVGFYKTTPHRLADVAQIKGWYMPIGRLHSSREHWEQTWPNLWAAIPQVQARKTQRQHFSSAGVDAYVCFQQQLYDPRSADVYCWTSKQLTSQIVAAIRDWGYKQGYRSLIMAVNEKIRKGFGDEVETMPHQQIIYTRDV